MQHRCMISFEEFDLRIDRDTCDYEIMDKNKRRRGVHVTARQKKILIEFITKHPELISCKVTQDFNYSDSQKLWLTIASECNSIPGARKTWRQWRKTWQDLRSKTKKRLSDGNVELPASVVLLSQAEQEVLGIKDTGSTSNCQESTEFQHSKSFEFDSELDETHTQERLDNGDSLTSYCHPPESPPEEKVFRKNDKNKIINTSKHKHYNNDEHSSTCVFNCDVLAKQEIRKINMKEEYLNFKKDYLKQKLKLLKEQTEAFKSIAKELRNK